jgi:hypothetical protein
MSAPVCCSNAYASLPWRQTTCKLTPDRVLPAVAVQTWYTDLVVYLVHRGASARLIDGRGKDNSADLVDTAPYCFSDAFTTTFPPAPTNGKILPGLCRFNMHDAFEQLPGECLGGTLARPTLIHYCGPAMWDVV